MFIFYFKGKEDGNNRTRQGMSKSAWRTVNQTMFELVNQASADKVLVLCSPGPPFFPEDTEGRQRTCVAEVSSVRESDVRCGCFHGGGEQVQCRSSHSGNPSETDRKENLRKAKSGVSKREKE